MEEIQLLLEKYLKNRCSPVEAEQILEWLMSDEHGLEQREFIARSLAQKPLADKLSHYNEVEKKLGENYEIVSQKIDEEKIQGRQTFRLPGRYRWVAAAAIAMLVIGGAITFQVLRTKGGGANQKNLVSNDRKLETDLPPGTDKATLTLADGSTIKLDKTTFGTLARQGSTNITQRSTGVVSYDHGARNANEVLYNVITTPRGGQYQLVLADGSRVWLNASSVLRFPTSFSGTERKVEVTGEAYFEIAHNASQPFVVKVNASSPDGGSEIEVLGTHFDIDAYSEEPEVKTTLLEGSVRIKKAGAMRVLLPGQQAKVSSQGIALEKKVNIQQVIAWKNGFFWFEDTDIKTLMLQVSKWYDIDVDFEGDVGQEGFSGKIPKSVSLSQFLQMLDLSGVHVKKQGNKLIVTP